jgi:hypothetical protein
MTGSTVAAPGTLTSAVPPGEGFGEHAPPALSFTPLGQLARALREKDIHRFFEHFNRLQRHPDFVETYDLLLARWEGEWDSLRDRIRTALSAIRAELDDDEPWWSSEKGLLCMESLADCPGSIEFAELRQLSGRGIQDLVERLHDLVHGSGSGEDSYDAFFGENEHLFRLRLLRELFRDHICGIKRGVGKPNRRTDHDYRLRGLIDQTFPKSQLGYEWSLFDDVEVLLELFPDSFMSGAGPSLDLDLDLLAKLWNLLDRTIAMDVARKFPGGSRLLAPLPSEKRPEEREPKEQPRPHQPEEHGRNAGGGSKPTTQRKEDARKNKLRPEQHPHGPLHSRGSRSLEVSGIFADIEQDIREAKAQAFLNVAEKLGIEATVILDDPRRIGACAPGTGHRASTASGGDGQNLIFHISRPEGRERYDVVALQGNRVIQKFTRALAWVQLVDEMGSDGFVARKGEGSRNPIKRLASDLDKLGAVTSLEKRPGTKKDQRITRVLTTSTSIQVCHHSSVGDRSPDIVQVEADKPTRTYLN